MCLYFQNEWSIDFVVIIGLYENMYYLGSLQTNLELKWYKICILNFTCNGGRIFCCCIFIWKFGHDNGQRN